MRKPINIAIREAESAIASLDTKIAEGVQASLAGEGYPDGDDARRDRREWLQGWVAGLRGDAAYHGGQPIWADGYRRGRSMRNPIDPDSAMAPGPFEAFDAYAPDASTLAGWR